MRLLRWLTTWSRPVRLALWLSVYAACCVVEFALTAGKEHSGERVKELWKK